VLGAGIVGASAAFHLAKAGADVLVVDDGRTGRATLAAAGIVGFPWPDGAAPEDGLGLAAAAYAAYPELAESIGLGPRSGQGFEIVGQLYVDRPGPGLDDLYERAARFCASAPVRAGVGAGRGRARSAGAGRAERGIGKSRAAVERLSPRQTLACCPFLGRELAAVRMSGTARVDGEAVRVALLRAARRLGARSMNESAHIQLDDERRATVFTRDGQLPADAIIVAAGAWSPQLFAPHGPRLPVRPQRGQLLHLKLAGVDTGQLPVIQPVGRHHYVLPFPGGRIVVGATRESSSGLTPRVTAGGMASVLRDALSIAPGLADATVTGLRVGMRPVTPDGHPLLGRIPGCEGVFVATGTGSDGLAIGPYCGALVARLALGAPPGIDITAFAPDRQLAE
jgi:D-amino-acid dehydrogenase